MFNARNGFRVTILIGASIILAGCAQTQKQQSPWASISSTPQQQQGYYGDRYMGNKVDRQINRQQSHVDYRINRETDQAVDSAVDGMLDSIFE